MTKLRQDFFALLCGGETVTVSAGSLDCTGGHLFWPTEASPGLRASWRLVGQLAPVLVDFAPQRPVLVAGLTRVRLARELGCALLALPVGGVGPYVQGGQPLTPYELGLSYVASNQERAVQGDGFESRLVLAGRYFQGVAGDSCWLPVLAQLYGRDSRDKLFVWLGEWLKLPLWLDELVHAGRVGLASSTELSALDEESLAALLPFLRLCNWPRKLCADVLSWLRQTALRQGESVAALCRTLDLAGITGSPNDIARLARLAVRGARFPRLSELEERFARHAKRLDPASKLKLSPDQGFETGRVSLSAVLASRADLGQLIEILSAGIDDPNWDALWRLADSDDV